MAHMRTGAAIVGRSKAQALTTQPAGGSLGFSNDSTQRIVARVEQGFPFSTLVRFHKSTGLPMDTTADLVRIPRRTLMRRKAMGRLQTDESERLLRIARVFDLAVELFEGNREHARRWLTTPREEFAGQSPLGFSRTEIGAREVEGLIGRLEHGVFS
jgi:putative toxin-antitoxin system antitoxin component (TIGR02293 family)